MLRSALSLPGTSGGPSLAPTWLLQNNLVNYFFLDNRCSWPS